MNKIIILAVCNPLLHPLDEKPEFSFVPNRLMKLINWLGFFFFVTKDKYHGHRRWIKFYFARIFRLHCAARWCFNCSRSLTTSSFPFVFLGFRCCWICLCRVAGKTNAKQNKCRTVNNLIIVSSGNELVGILVNELNCWHCEECVV